MEKSKQGIPNRKMESTSIPSTPTIPARPAREHRVDLCTLEREVFGVEFCVDQCEIVAAEPFCVMINGLTRREMSEDDYQDVCHYGGAYFDMLAHMIEMDSEGEVELVPLDDILGERRLFLVFVGNRKPRAYVCDALNDILRIYQAKDRDSRSELKWHRVVVRDRSFF